MSTQPYLSVVPAYGAPPRRKPHNTNRGRKFPPEPLSTEDFAKLLAACVPLRAGREHELSAKRLRCLLVILYRTGVRIAEALDLYESDLGMEERSITIRHGKGDKRRVLLVDEWAWREILYWLRIREEIPPGALIPVIRGDTAGGPMAAPDIRRQLKYLRERAGVRKRVHPHGFRHSFAVEASREGIGLYSLQGALGHARLDAPLKQPPDGRPHQRLVRIGHVPPRHRRLLAGPVAEQRRLRLVLAVELLRDLLDAPRRRHAQAAHGHAASLYGS